MALAYLESNSGRRASFLPEARRLPHSSGDIFLAAAFNMAEKARIYLTEPEAKLYRDKRKPLPEEGGSAKCDQALLAEDVLSGERSTKVKQAFVISSPRQ